MADLRISQLTELTTPLTSDIFPIVNSNETKKVTLQSINNNLPITTFVQANSAALTFPFADENAPCIVNGQQLFFVAGMTAFGEDDDSPASLKPLYKDWSGVFYIEYDADDSCWRMGESGSSFTQSAPTSTDYPWLATWSSGLTVQRAISGMLPTSHTHRTALPYLAGFMSGDDKLKLDGIAAGAEVNVNADWNATTGDAQILNKPSFNTGKTIYVDAVVGTDTRTGLSKYDASKPFLTIAAAVDASEVATGDTVYVRAGTYSITATIPLNLKGNLHFETGALVSVANGVVAFSYSQNSVPISVTGNANFSLGSGACGILDVTGGNSTTAVLFVCNSVSNAANDCTGSLFRCAAGALSVQANLIQAILATAFNVTASGSMTVRIPFVYCGKFLISNGNALSRFNCDCWTIQFLSTDAGIDITSIGSTNFRIVNYNNNTVSGIGFRCNWSDNNLESHLFQDMRWNIVGSAALSLSSTTTTTTNKKIFLKGANILRYSSPKSIDSTVPVDVYVTSSFATISADANVTFKVGSFTVDSLVDNMGS